MTDKFIERRIVTGLIISTEYLLRIRKDWSSKMLKSKMAKTLANWCIDFYDKYNTAPGEEIQTIFQRKSKKLSDEERDDIEDILSSLSDDFERDDKFNVDYLMDQTTQYFDERNLSEFVEKIKGYVDDGNLVEAKKIAHSFVQPVSSSSNYLDMSSPEVLDAVDRAFARTSEPLVRYPRQLGQFLNDKLIRGGFVSFMAAEKKGKSYLLLDMAMRAVDQNVNVALFQAGDMSEEDWVLRTCIYLTKKSDKKKDCGIMYEPMRDCMHNQMNTCTLKQRECDFGIFDDKDISFLRSKVEYKELVDKYEDNPKYKPCWNCNKYWTEKYGAVWLKKVDVGEPMDVNSAKKIVDKFFIKGSKRLRISTHPNGTLSVTDANNMLDLWEREDGFVADFIIFDYGDIMAAEITGDFRHKENDKWMRMRATSQKRHALVVNVTQTDADSYDQDRLTQKNFSEDKRKYAHVTAMYGLNQDRMGREKEIGIMRINEIMVRNASFSVNNEVYVLQNLKRGQPCLSSFW